MRPRTLEEALERRHDPVIELWSIQTETNWERSLKRGAISCDRDKIPDPEFGPAYQWLVEQMQERVYGYGSRFPVWAWYWPKPDMRRRAYHTPAREIVRLRIVLPSSRVLLSDFDAWHSRLNDHYLALYETEWDAWEARGKQREEVVESWNKMFDLDTLARAHAEHADWFGNEMYIQATVEEIQLSEVCSVEPFIAR